MPFTPFHLGPGALFKAFGGRYFSFMVFGISQVLMDIEPLLGILQNKDILHGYTHTLSGAFLIGALAGIVGKPVSSLVLKWLSTPRFPFHSLTWGASFTGAYIGTFSHVFLDAIMHSDMSPLSPLSSRNPLLGILSIDGLHASCAFAGIVGIIVMIIRFRAGTANSPTHNPQEKGKAG